MAGDCKDERGLGYWVLFPDSRQISFQFNTCEHLLYVWHALRSWKHKEGLIDYLLKINQVYKQQGIPRWLSCKESACQCRSCKSLIPGLGSYRGEENGNLLQYSCWENPMDGLAGYSLWGGEELDMTEQLSAHKEQNLVS